MQITCYRGRLNAELNCLALLFLQVPGAGRGGKTSSVGKFVGAEELAFGGRRCPGVWRQAVPSAVPAGAAAVTRRSNGLR